MLTWDNAIYFCQKQTRDDSSDSEIYFKLMMNHYYKEILAIFGRAETREEKTCDLVADQQDYQVSPDFKRAISFVVTDGTTKWPLQEVESQENWDYINRIEQTSSVPRLFFIKPRLGVGGAVVELYPIPSSADYDLIMVYEATTRDLAVDAYTTGTVSVTHDDTTVAGDSTVFIDSMIGRYFNITSTTGDGLWYRIADRDSDVSIELENYYDGSTLTGLSYQICEAFALPEEMQILPCYGALFSYYGMRKDPTQEAKYYKFYTAGIADAKREYSNKSRNPLIKRFSHRKLTYPSYFPQDGISS